MTLLRLGGPLPSPTTLDVDFVIASEPGNTARPPPAF